MDDAPKSQDVMEMCLCEAGKVVLRVNQLYRFVHCDCESCDKALAAAVEAYGPSKNDVAPTAQDVHQAGALRGEPEAAGQGWRPIETAPKDSTSVLIYGPKLRQPVQEAWWAIAYEGAIDGYWSTPTGPAGRGYTILPSAVTHWRPLPEPPKTASGCSQGARSDGQNGGEQGATPPAPAATIAALMEQAQVYASAWSLVGGRFDDGTFHAAAMTEKDALRGMLTAALAASPQPAAPVEIDYPAAIAYCYKKLGHAQGTKGCIAFARGAEWMRDQIASAQAAEGGAS